MHLADRLSRVGIVCGAGDIGETKDLAMSYRVMALLNAKAPWSLELLLRGFRLAMDLPKGGSGPGTKARRLCDLDREALRNPLMRRAVGGSFAEAMSGDVAEVVREGQLYLKPWGFRPEEIQMPAHFWHGREDKNITPRIPQELVERIPAASIDWYDGEGHYSIAHFHSGEFLETSFAEYGDLKEVKN